MEKLGRYTEDIISALTYVATLANNHNRAGRFDINRDAEEFYRGLLFEFYGWKLGTNANRIAPNFQGVDLLFLGADENKVAVQVTSENSSEKVHHSIKGFKEKSLKEGFTELYILMFTGKNDFPRVDFTKTVDGKFTFDKDKHIIDHSDLCAKLENADYPYVESIWKYLNNWNCIPYSNLDESIEDLDIIGEIFEHLFGNLPQKQGEHPNDSDVFAKLKVKVPLNFPKEQRDRLSDMIKNTTNKRLQVHDYLGSCDDTTRVLDLKEMIQQKYCEFRDVSNHEEPIKDIIFILKLVDYILPPSKKSNCHYQSNAKAIILLFFEFCFIGKKTDEEREIQKSLF